MDSLITAKYIIPVVPENQVLEHHTVVVKDSRIVEILPREEAHAKYTANDVVDLKDHALIPGLVNAHTHSPMVFFRGIGDDLPLISWLVRCRIKASFSIVVP